MLISLRGTNGSGKSTVIRTLFDMCSPHPIYSVLGPKRPEAYELRLPKVKQPTYVLGPYHIGSGGCDSIQPYDLIPVLIKKYAAKGHVIFEGIIVTSVYGQVGTLMEEWKKDSMFLFLDTTFEECIRRIEKRRGGKVRDDRLLRNVKGKYDSALRVKKRVEQEKIMRYEMVSDTKAPKRILTLLQEA